MAIPSTQRRPKLLYLTGNQPGLGCGFDEVNRSLKKWAFGCAAALALAVVGCGGNGSSNSGGGTAGSTGGTTFPTAQVRIPNQQFGLVYVAFLTGQARATGDLYMNLEDATIVDNQLNKQVSRAQLSPVKIHLAAYTLQYVTLDPPEAGLNSEVFDQFLLDPFSFATEQADGSVGLNPGDPGVFLPDQNTLPQSIPTRLRVFPGRDSLLPLFVDDSMFSVQNNTGVFDYDQFKAVNMPATANPNTTGKVVGYLSDYVQFDLSHVPAANVPHLLVSGKAATHFYFSGDNYAMSDDGIGQSSGNFEQLTLDPNNPLDGLMAQPNTPLSNQFAFANFPGTYDLRQANPTDLSGLSKITSLFGRWRKSTDLINFNGSSFDIIILPNTDESYSQANPTDVVAVAHNGSTITNIYAGFAYFNATSGKPKAVLFPLPGFVNASVSGEVDYDLSDYKSGNGNPVANEPDIRFGSFTLDAGSPNKPPTGFANSGTFVVFR
ncbi:MAG TPA: hypothetical protein VG944_21245 [Fimbriimonas sp.]|nr:hypothetical protein [Fimbriimonas sp.]